MPLLTSALLALALSQTPPPVSQPQAPVAPQQTQTPARLRVFLDCDCFSEYIRNEVTFVDYVRQRESADVHVLGQSRETGGSGREHNLNFVGLGRLDGFNLDLRALTTASDTEDTRRRAVQSVLTSGFLVYMAKAEIPGRLEIDVEADEAQQAAPADDPWNFWVYSLRANTDLQAEESSREFNWGLSASADRVTEDWKMSFGLRSDQTREQFDLDEDEPFESRRHSREFDLLVVKSLGQHWSAGLTAEIGSSSFDNLRFQAVATPAVEFSVFPYQEYARRQFTATYAIGPRHNRYYEETLFGKVEETRGHHEIDFRYDQRERWGSLRAGFEAGQYLPDTDLYRLEVDGDVSLRILRGLSLSLEANASLIRDQISLPSRGATVEERLRRLRQLQTGYEYSFEVSFTYTFGSIFNNVVNPRFGGGNDFDGGRGR
ncbi:MAG: hypothetical protein WD690_12965 [Vicinamibacterales bacterium]